MSAAPVPHAEATMAATVDNAHLLQELETAAQVLLAPPNLVSSEQRHAAEAVFLRFRRTRSQPFAVARHILETSRVDYVLFEAAGLVKEGLIREWSSLTKEDVAALRAYLLQYVIGRGAALSGYVRERLVQVMAIIVKRQSVEDGGEDRRAVLAEVQETLIARGSVEMQMVGCSVLQAMMQEYATTVKSSDVGLPWETHFRCKKQFEVTDLKSIFEFCVGALRELGAGGRVGPGMPREVSNLVLRLTTLAEGVLSWTFINVNLPKKLISVFESDQNPSLRPGAPWKETILQPAIAQLFFELHVKVRHDPELAHHTMNCLVQLSSLNGSVMAKKEARLEYLTNYLRQFLTLLASITNGGGVGGIQANEALGCSNIVRKLILFFPPSLMVSVEPQLLEEYLARVTELTCHFMKASAAAAKSSGAVSETRRRWRESRRKIFVFLFLADMF